MDVLDSLPKQIMKIYPLSTHAKECAVLLADIHLRSTLINLTKIISDTIFYVVGKDKIGLKTTKEGDLQYWYKGCHLRPPSPRPSLWSIWAGKNWYQFWWVVDYAYQVDMEYRFRFDIPKDVTNPEYRDINDWIVSGVQNIIPRPKSCEIGELPLALAYKDLTKLGDTTKLPVIDVYRKFYVNQLGKVRMRWTKRSLPSFFPST